MTLTAKEQFRLGFLTRCAEEGLTPAEVKQRVKAAWPTPPWREAGEAAKSLAGLYLKAPFLIGGLGLSAATLGGAGLGYGAAKLSEENTDPDEAKQQELIAAYRRHSERARRLAARQQHRRPRPQGPQLFTG